jgi:hypothetical protein
MAQARKSPGPLLELEQDPALAELVSDWDFSPGKRFQAEVLHKFSSSVHHTSSSPDGSFFMLVVFRRFLFRLTEDSVAMALHCCLGGSPAGFHVAFQNERHFRFSVASKHVGLLVRALNRITTDHFDIYFHMWRDGGADWKREWRKWEKEEKDSWITKSSKRSKRKMSAKKVSFDEKLIQDSPVRKSRPRELTSVFRVGDVLCPATPLTCFVFGSKSTILNLGKPSEFSSCNQAVFNEGLLNNSEDFTPVSDEMNTDDNTIMTSYASSAEHYSKDSHSGHFRAPAPSVVSVQRVFQKLKADLNINCNNGPAAISLQSKYTNGQPPPQGVIFNFSPSPSIKLCYRCLSSKHLVRECRGEIRCIYCFNYGHRA